MNDTVRQPNASDDEIDECLHNLAEVVAEELHKEYESELEPFEHYIQRVRLHLYAGIGDYPRRVANGYRILIDAAHKEGKDGGDKMTRHRGH